MRDDQPDATLPTAIQREGTSAMTAGPTAQPKPLQRMARRRPPQMVPAPVDDEPGLVVVDATWGTLTPMQLGPGVRTVGELEVIEHIRAGQPLIDTRPPHFHHSATIPGARNIPHDEVLDQIDTLDAAAPTVFFCNGPACSATPLAIDALLEAGHPAGAILYYRGGMHDWMTLGLPVTGSADASAD
jgi:rhodanese-related sulfurtransferase